MDVVVCEAAANGLLDEDLYLVIFFRLSDCKLSILVIRRFKSRGADEFFSFLPWLRSVTRPSHVYTNV